MTPSAFVDPPRHSVLSSHCTFNILASRVRAARAHALADTPVIHLPAKPHSGFRLNSAVPNLWASKVRKQTSAIHMPSSVVIQQNNHRSSTAAPIDCRFKLKYRSSTDPRQPVQYCCVIHRSFSSIPPQSATSDFGYHPIHEIRRHLPEQPRLPPTLTSFA